MNSTTLRELSERVSRYFMDFLESDFKKQSLPRRKIALQTESGFRAGMRIAPYPELNRKVWSGLGESAIPGPEINITPGAYTRPASQTLKAIIKQQIEAIPPEAVHTCLHTLATYAQTSRPSALTNPEDWVDSVREAFASSVGDQIVRPLLALLDGTLARNAYSAIDSIYTLETEIIERLCSETDTLLPETLARFLATGDSSPLLTNSADIFTLENAKASLLAYFDNFVTADAFLEYRDLDTFARTSEGKQLYLYIGSLKYAGALFPLFFIPLESERTERGFKLKPTNHLYANKRAIDYVLQETAERQSRQWVSPLSERITYLEPDQAPLDHFADKFNRVLSAFGFADDEQRPKDGKQSFTNSEVTIGQDLFFAVYDSADEALLNDYEELLVLLQKEEKGVTNLFEGIVKAAIEENPKSIAQEIDRDWDSMPIVDRLVFESPVPLNEEQIKVLQAIRKDQGKFILVEGPPGCGKSHTITAIAADCILNNRSCLVLSDKREALDVVQGKVSDVMSRVRHDKDFPNPILRLGQQQTNFRKLISGSTVAKVSSYAKSAKSNEEKLLSELNHKDSQLKAQIKTTAEQLSGLALTDIERLHVLEGYLQSHSSTVCQELTAISTDKSSSDLDEIIQDRAALEGYFGDVYDLLPRVTEASFAGQVAVDAVARKLLQSESMKTAFIFRTLSPSQLRKLSLLVLEYEEAKMPLFGYLFRGAMLRRQNSLILAEFDASRPVNMKNDATLLKSNIESGNKILDSLKEYRLLEDRFSDVYESLVSSRSIPASVRALQCVLRSIGDKGQALPESMFGQRTKHETVQYWMHCFEFLAYSVRLQKVFASIPVFDYLGSKSDIERLRISRMNTEVDARLVAYLDNNRADARNLASLVAQRQKFPAEKFGEVKNSFPLILASIREFGEYMPLVHDLFDVVVIDEASQVSIAQALPALLRARKVVVLGDSKQFSNTKSANASIALNDKYKGELRTFFASRVSSNTPALARLELFDVKKSVLEFVKSFANIEIVLRKHFRSYQELISYSSKHFYSGTLQALKVRGCPIGDVIRFSEVKTKGFKVSRGTNEAEGQFILKKLHELLESEKAISVGVITPFREQQTYLSKLFFSDLRGAEFETRLKLKVMTFDSCQGEERQIIFYSLVATEKHDALNYIFPVSLESAEQSVEEKLKVQRLNVGFSRAQEMIWFVHSKPLSAFRGSIGGVLNHYQSVLSARMPVAEQTDSKSPMEAKVLGWLKSSAFYQLYSENIEVVAQFPVGDYLRELNPTYTHPSYKTDFLLTFSGEGGQVRIIIEYDGFEYHFEKGASVNAGNYERYMHEGDVERQFILESYGYRFVRINRFNLGKDPVATLSDRLFALTAQVLSERRSEALASLTEAAEGLASKEMIACSRCKQVKALAEFYDVSLKSGYGRVCSSCKLKRR